MGGGGEAFGFEGGGEIVGSGAEVWQDAHHVEPIGMFAAGRGQLQAAAVFKLRAESVAPSSAPGDDVGDFSGLCQGDGSLELGHAIIVGEEFGSARSAGLAAVGFVGGEAKFSGEGGVVGDDDTAVAATDVFEFVETVAAAETEMADGFAVIGGAVGLGAVFDDGDVFLLGDLLERIEIAGVAGKVHGDDGAGFFGDVFEYGFGEEICGMEVQVGEDGNGALVENRDDGAHVGDGWDDDFIAG